MKTHILTLAAIAALTTLGLADSPDAILKDYQAKATPALEKVNATLEKATVPLIADLVKAGDTTAAEELKAQLKAKQDGEPVMKPHAKAISLFTLYDAARLKTLDPAQKAAVARIDSMLASSDGKKLEMVEALGKVRAEIEAGRISDPGSMPVEWTYHQTINGKPDASIKMKPDGVFEIDDGEGVKTGTWKANKKNSFVTIDFNNDTWKVTVKDGVGTIQRDVGTRYMRLITSK